MIFEEIILSVQKGDRIKSKKGILLLKSPISGKDYVVYDIEYLGDGKWKVHSDKKEVELK